MLAETLGIICSIMEDNLTKILLALLIGLIGYFTRDIYNFVKRKIIRSRKPKVVLEYTVKANSSHGMNPRLYKFIGNLLIQNIDTKPIYKLRLVLKTENGNEEILNENHLSPNDKRLIKKETEIPFGETGTDYVGAQTELPEQFQRPNYIMHFENGDGHKFKQKVIII